MLVVAGVGLQIGTLMQATGRLSTSNCVWRLIVWPSHETVLPSITLSTQLPNRTFMRSHDANDWHCCSWRWQLGLGEMDV